MKLLRRKEARRSPAADEEKSHPLLLFFQIFQPTCRTFSGYPSPIWGDPPRPTCCLHHRIQFQVPDCRHRLAPSPKTCQKVPCPNRQPPLANIFWVVVRLALVTIGHIVTSKSFTSYPTDKNDQAPPESLPLIAGKCHTSRSDIIIAGELSGEATSVCRRHRPPEHHGSTPLLETKSSGRSPVSAASIVVVAEKPPVLPPS